MSDWLNNPNRSLTQVFRTSKDEEPNKYNDEYQALTDAHHDWMVARSYSFSSSRRKTLRIFVEEDER